MRRAARKADKSYPVHRRLGENRQILEHQFQQNAEIQFREITFGTGRGTRRVLFLYTLGFTDMDALNQFVLPIFHDYFAGNHGRLTASHLKATMPLIIASVSENIEGIAAEIYRGMLVVIVDGINAGFAVDVANPPQRQPEEPRTEVSIRGPRDGFVEDIDINIALVRKRLPSSALRVEQFVVGMRTQTRVMFVYLSDIIDSQIVKDVRKRLGDIYVDGIMTSTQLEELLADTKHRLVPSFSYSGRPDFVGNALLKGRFAVFMDGTPAAVIGPANLALLFQSAEDDYINSPFLFVQRYLRFMGAVFSIFLPGLYVAIVTYHIDRIPINLLGTFVTARHGVPVPTPVEVLIMLGIFEMLREAGNRLPAGLGQTLAVVGGLIIGEAAIEAGLVSSTVLVITGTTAVASFTISNQSLAGSFVVFRLVIVVLSAILGEFGFLMGLYACLIYLSTIQSFGVPYLSPFSPFRPKDVRSTFGAQSTDTPHKRPTILRAKDQTRT